jgi:hypothetical protein
MEVTRATPAGHSTGGKEWLAGPSKTRGKLAPRGAKGMGAPTHTVATKLAHDGRHASHTCGVHIP